MLKRPLILGSKGGMGRRYSAILKHLKVDHVGIDVGDPFPKRGDFDSLIIATPTHLHIQHIRKVFDWGLPILCEKPISTNLLEVLELCQDAKVESVKLRMVNQYSQLVISSLAGPTQYNYFRHGTDGLSWDCINILGMASEDCVLSEESPVWSCTINGDTLGIQDMDWAYRSMIQGWLKGEHENIDYIRHAHIKAMEHACQKQS